MRVKVIFATTLVFALSIISTTFTLLALTSKDWSEQSLYVAGYQNGSSNLPPDGTKEFSPVCVVPRSPFYRCNLPHVYWNSTCELDCQWYQPYGWNKTSCRSAAEFGASYQNASYEALLGHAQECQEVHYAGNLQIAASTFIVVGLCAALVLCTSTILLGVMESKKPSDRSAHSQGSSAEEGQDAIAVQHDVESKSLQRDRHRKHHGPTYEDVPRHAGSSATPWAVAFFLGCLYIGAFLQLLAQFFGVLGLTVSATPKQDAELLVFQDIGTTDQGDNYDPDSWVIGRALSTYATVAWTSAVLCATVATLVMRRPRIAKVL